MRRRQWRVFVGGILALFVLSLIYGFLEVIITVLVTGLTLAAFSGLFFDKREDDVNKDISDG